ncbi:MAG: hypothetical protein ACXWU9_10355 [Telluria sp.]
MANREELGIIRGARAGSVTSQLELGRLYLFGGAGLPKSLPSALHWLERAAQQDSAEACELIGTHIPLELARQNPRPLTRCYERAHDAGVLRAGVVFAQLVLSGPEVQHGAALRAKALGALEAAAAAGYPDARRLLVQQRRAAPAPQPHAALALAQPAAPAAPYALLDAVWEAGDGVAFLERALPLARALARAALAARRRRRLAPADVVLLSRCARLLDTGPGGGVGGEYAAEMHCFGELAANEHDRDAQLAMGLWSARMRLDGRRTPAGAGSANFRKAIRWLTLSGEQGLAEAWYALSRIYSKPEFSQRNVSEAQRFLERAAAMGYRAAQRECGTGAWRARRENENNDVRAVYWLQLAAAQGCPDARAALRKIAPRLPGARLGTLQAASHPLLAARIELAALFGLSRAEALLLDVKAADRGHCLVIDIRGSYGRSKRRLVMVAKPREREALDRIVRAFDGIDAGPGGPEGNYRQRLYRLKTLAGRPAARDGRLS